MLGVVGVEALLDELAPAERVVVGVDAGPLLAEDAGPVAGEDAGSEALLVLLAVASLARCASTLLSFGLASVALAALRELGAAGG